MSWFGSDFEPALLFVGEGKVIETHEHKGDFQRVVSLATRTVKASSLRKVFGSADRPEADRTWDRAGAVRV